jgi:flagellar motor switch protein FliN
MVARQSGSKLLAKGEWHVADTVETLTKTSKAVKLRASDSNIDLLSAVSMRVSVEVGSASLSLAELLTLNEGSIVELDRQANDHLDIFANGTLIAKGEIVAIDGRYAVQVATVVDPAPHPQIDRRS